MKEVEAFIASLALGWQKRACQEILSDIVATEPNIDAEIKWGNPYFSTGRRAVVKWFVARDWINVYFFRGQEIEDTNGMFIDTDNRRMRTIRLFADSQINHPQLRDLLRQAVRLEIGP